MSDSFDGIKYRLANNWFHHLAVNEFSGRPIKYLEIGAFYGANLISVAKTYGAHPESKLHCIDPWIDYAEYPEYKGMQDTIYGKFLKNVAGISNKLVVHRGFSNEKVLTLEDSSFDLIYIDGNHEPEYVLEDAVLCFRKLKRGGFLIFDDYGWGGPELTKKGIDAFLSGYSKRIVNLGIRDSQVFVKKL
jgi:hypothetical protein